MPIPSSPPPPPPPPPPLTPPRADAPALDRFEEAQAPVMDAVRAEIAAGAKRTHWMWFVFPQLRALGRSAAAQRFGLEGVEEARAYLRHPVLGPRLRECCALLLGVRGRTLGQVLGSPDDLKLRSCMTLFEAAAPDEPVFAEVLERWCGGERDPLTLGALGRDRGGIGTAPPGAPHARKPHAAAAPAPVPSRLPQPSAGSRRPDKTP